MYGSGREAFPDIREWSGGPPDVRVWLGGPPGCPGVVGRLFRMSVSGGRPSQMFGSGRETLPDVWVWSRGPPGYPGVVGRPSRMSGSCREAFPHVR